MNPVRVDRRNYRHLNVPSIQVEAPPEEPQETHSWLGNTVVPLQGLLDAYAYRGVLIRELKRLRELKSSNELTQQEQEIVRQYTVDLNKALDQLERGAKPASSSSSNPTKPGFARVFLEKIKEHVSQAELDSMSHEANNRKEKDSSKGFLRHFEAVAKEQLDPQLIRSVINEVRQLCSVGN